MMTTAPASFAVAGSPSGERVKVAGRSVHHQSWGSVKPGQPTLWLENGWFGQLLGWGALPELLCQDGSSQDGWCVRAYDRGNYGWCYGAGETEPASLPLIALIADRPPLASISDPYQRALAAGWRASQEAAAAGNHRYVSAGHAIHRDAPEAILAAVREMREAIAV